MKRRIALTSVIASLALVTAACGSDDEASTTGSDTASSAEETSAEPTAEETSDEMMDPASMLVGAGCADYAAANPEGPASVDGMAAEPVATAASGNPLLTSLVAAVSGELNPDVNLATDLNGLPEATVFAPVDEAFAAIPAADLEALAADTDAFTEVLTTHVLTERLDPDEVVGEQTTLAGGTITVEGEGDNLTVNGANVICGGVQTANATVYLIDGVLMPAAS